MSEEAPLPAVERDTLDLALRSAPDPFLGDLIELAQHGTELAVGLLVNGMVVLGSLDGAEAIAQELSTMRRRLIDRSPKPEGQSEEQWEAVREGFTNAPLNYVAEREQAEAGVHQALSERADDGVVNMDDLPATLARQAREIATRTQITLTDARIAAPGQEGMTALPVLRVAVQHVTAWWFAMPDDEGRSNIELWSEGRGS